MRAPAIVFLAAKLRLILPKCLRKRGRDALAHKHMHVRKEVDAMIAAESTNAPSAASFFITDN